MYNAIIEDDMLNSAGIFKERLSQSALVAKMRTVSQAEAEAVYKWLVAKGVKFDFGKDPATELTVEQVVEQCKMYIAAVRIAHDFACDAIGIQYQQGLNTPGCAWRFCWPASWARGAGWPSPADTCTESFSLSHACPG